MYLFLIWCFFAEETLYQNDYHHPPPTREYLTPLKDDTAHHGSSSGAYGASKQPKLLPIAPKTPVLGVCPPIQRNVKCEYVQNTCWSVGTPDVDCPGNGLCCFNGCANHCLPAPNFLPSNFHVPPNQAYLVPGKEYLFLDALASKRRNEEGGNSFLSPMYSLGSFSKPCYSNFIFVHTRPLLNPQSGLQNTLNFFHLPNYC